jgi:hypothetical protein
VETYTIISSFEKRLDAIVPGWKLLDRRQLNRRAGKVLKYTELICVKAPSTRISHLTADQNCSLGSRLSHRIVPHSTIALPHYRVPDFGVSYHIIFRQTLYFPTVKLLTPQLLFLTASLFTCNCSSSNDISSLDSSPLESPLLESRLDHYRPLHCYDHYCELAYR